MPLLQIALMLKLNEFQVGLEGISQRVREHGNPIFRAFAVADHDLTRTEIHIEDSQSTGFKDTQATAIQNGGDKPGQAFHSRE